MFCLTQIMTGILTSHQYSYLCVRTYSTYTRSIRFLKQEAAVKNREKRKSDHRSYRSFARRRRTTTTIQHPTSNIQLMFQFPIIILQALLFVISLFTLGHPGKFFILVIQTQPHCTHTHTLGLARLHAH